MEIKLLCNCGQKYKFDVEPVGGKIPFQVNCPVCGLDGTPLANAYLAQFPTHQPIRVNVAPPTPPPIPNTPAPIAMPPRAAPAIAAPARNGKDFNLGLGVVGAFVGALVGAGLMAALSIWAQFKFPLFGVCTGALTGYGARLLARGTANTLGAIAGVIAFLAVGGSLYFIMEEFLAAGNIVSLLVSVSVAYRIAA